MSVDAELLRSLCLAPGPTGFEAPAQEVVRRRLAPLGEVQADPLGNIWLDVGPAVGPQVVVTAHADQIGLIVTYVDEHGYLFVEKIGGVAPLLVPGRHFVIHGAGGPVHAVGGKKPTHIIPADEREKAPALDEQFLDIGASSREAAFERVAIGDPITFTPDFIELSPGVFGAQALDDRAGVYCLVRALELLVRVLEREREHVGHLILAAVFTVQGTDAPLADEDHRKFGVVDRLGLEHARHQQGHRFAVDVHARAVEHLDEVHDASSPRRSRAASRCALAASARSP